MIGQLLRTKFESNFLILTGLVLVNALTLPMGGEGSLVCSLLASSVFGAGIYLRDGRDRRTRLFSQLPVTTHQVSIASWCFTLICLLLPTCS